MLAWKRVLVAATALLAAVLAVTGCGGGQRVEPLIGDDPEILRHVRTIVPDVSGHAPTRAVHALYEALLREDFDAAWDVLSAETRASLDEAARATPARGGKALFVTSGESGGLPLQRTDGEAEQVPALAWLLAPEIAYYLLTLDPERPPQESESEAVVYIIDPNERYRAIRVRREEGRWLVHHPSLRAEDVPGLTPDVGRTALP